MRKRLQKEKRLGPFTEYELVPGADYAAFNDAFIDFLEMPPQKGTCFFGGVVSDKAIDGFLELGRRERDPGLPGPADRAATIATWLRAHPALRTGTLTLGPLVDAWRVK